jgi:hypothetical protein
VPICFGRGDVDEQLTTGSWLLPSSDLLGLSSGSRAAV